MARERNTPTNPAELRDLLVETMVGVLEGRVNCTQANAVANLSAEVHRSLEQQWDQAQYVAEHLTLEQGKVINGYMATATIEHQPDHE